MNEKRSEPRGPIIVVQGRSRLIDRKYFHIQSLKKNLKDSKQLMGIQANNGRCADAGSMGPGHSVQIDADHGRAATQYGLVQKSQNAFGLAQTRKQDLVKT